ncbi:hypothetical protein GI582_24420 [Sulfitobacter sp. BDSS02]|uniref:hypothetical protein n=1 Tax=Heliomarina sp. TaxID=2917556 RepID=UPI004059B5E9|nr:hypothetical protein [Sulfitobacter sp. BDSS02]MBR9852430.1 site-specific integrase [Paracoccaceae bacterium]
MSSLETRIADLASRMPHVPNAVTAPMQTHLLQNGDFSQRGMPAVLEEFYARLEAAGLPPERVTDEIFRGVGRSRSRFRCLIAALRQFAPAVPLAASAPVKQEWDRWLNDRYNKKAPVARRLTRVGLAPEAWPDSWSSALPVLDRTVRPYGRRLRKLGPKTRQAVISSVGLLARSRTWAEKRGVNLPVEPSEDLFLGYLHYLQEERVISFGTARDYLERARMFFLRAGMFDEAGYATVGELIGALNEEATDEDPGKWAKLRAFRREFTLADILKKARTSSEGAHSLPGHSTAAFKLRQKGMIYALLVNSGDRQGDLRKYRIGIDLVRDKNGDWRHGIRQNKTGNTKEIEALWPGTSALIDRHILGDRPDWLILDRLQEVDGLNLLTLSEQVVHKGYINARLKQDFRVHGHLVRTMIADLIRRTRPDALWALQQMLGHTDRTTQKVYRSEFDESQAVRAFDELYARLSE